jgi:hypothetical protein
MKIEPGCTFVRKTGMNHIVTIDKIRDNTVYCHDNNGTYCVPLDKFTDKNFIEILEPVKKVNMYG